METRVKAGGAGKASKAGEASKASTAALPAFSHARRGSRRHLLRAMTTETSVRSGEFNAVHEDNGRYVDPQQEHHNSGDRPLNEGEARVAGDVPGEAIERQPPEHAGQRRAHPDIPKACLRVRNEIEDEADAEDQDDGRRVLKRPRLH